MRILVLATSNNDAVKSIVRAGEARGHEMVVKNPRWLYLLISDKVNGYDAVYDGLNQDDRPVKLMVSEYDAIIPRLGNNLSYSLSVLEHLNNNLRIFSTQSSPGIRTASDKLISQQKFSQAKLRTPRTILGDEVRHPDWMIKQIGGLPGIAKSITGSLGNGVYILESALQTNVFLLNFAKHKNKLLLQSYINSGEVVSDIRAICIDGQVIVAMQRTARKGEVRANIDKGGSGIKIDLSDQDKEICIRACNAVGLACAGVDLIKDKDGTTYLIEINGNYGYKVETLTGVDISTPLIQYCERSYKNRNNGNLKSNEELEEEKIRMKYEEVRNEFPATYTGVSFEAFRSEYTLMSKLFGNSID